MLAEHVMENQNSKSENFNKNSSEIKMYVLGRRYHVLFYIIKEKLWCSDITYLRLPEELLTQINYYTHIRFAFVGTHELQARVIAVNRN